MKIFRKSFAVLLLPFAVSPLPAQNGITISDFSTTVGTPSTVTFKVSWNKTVSGRDSAWVFADYNNAGTMTRLSLENAGHTASAGTVTAPNNQGAWLVTDTPTSGNFTSTISLRSAATYLAGACVYAVNYFPKGRYTSASTVVFNGTPKYDVVLKNAGSISKVESPYKVPDGDALLSFADATGAPGTISCLPPNPQTLVALPSYCANVSGVDISLANTQKGVIYEFVNEDSKAVVATQNGLDNGGSVSFGTHGAGSYSVRSKAEGAFCAIAVSGTHTVMMNPLPGAPTSPSSNARCGGGAVTFGATAPDGCTIDWYTAATNGSIVSGGTGVTSFAPNISQTITYYAQSRNTTTGCVSASRTAVTGTVNAVPGAPTSPSSNARCGEGAVTFGATAPGGCTIDWYTAATNGSIVSGGTGVTSFAPSIAQSTTYYAQARNITTGCLSASRITVGGTVNPVPGAPTSPSSNARCGGGAVTFNATAPGGCTIDWYTAATNGSIVSGGSGVTSFVENLTSTKSYYAQARNTSTTCISSSRTTVTGTVKEQPSVSITPASSSITPTNSVTLTANVEHCSGCSYRWSNNATTPSIMLNAQNTGVVANYSCVVTNAEQCTATATAKVSLYTTHFASTATVTAGGRVWSDHVQFIPTSCMLSTLPNSDDAAKLFYIIDGKFYYNHACIKDNLSALCPSGWAPNSSVTQGCSSGAKNNYHNAATRLYIAGGTLNSGECYLVYSSSGWWHYCGDKDCYQYSLKNFAGAATLMRCYQK